MPKLCFPRCVVGHKVLVLEVKQIEDLIFYRFESQSQSLDVHPLRVHNQLAKCKLQRTSPINLCEMDYLAYVKIGRFIFRGLMLQKGGSKFFNFKIILLFKVKLHSVHCFV